MANNDKAQPIHMSTPDPALKRLEKLVGTWNITGRTPDSQDDNISGRVTIEWLSGGFFLQQRGEMHFLGSKIQTLEIVGYNSSTKVFSSSTYSNIGGVPFTYQWDVQGDVVTHWNESSKYMGTFSAKAVISSQVAGDRKRARRARKT